ncbi:josephin-like protein [Ipomoea triloba]|uniref:josephin-like protein n=1 Tax=Ipomoea triloba TaxID=35885 RepID=UPI00125E57A2|nr:josephin-like protein [Ipomoea triloba]
MSARGELGTGTRRPSNDKRRTSSSVLQKQNSSKRATTTDGNSTKVAKCTTCSFNRSDSPSSAIRYLKLLGGKMVAAFRMMSPKRSRKVTSSETTAKPPVPAPAPPALDSHRAEAIHDCIQFINSSSSLPRSNSVSYQG